MKKKNQMSKNQKWTLTSTSAGFAMEHMDVMFISFAMAPIIMQLHISKAAGGMIASITNIGQLLGALIFGYLADTFGRVKVFTYTIFLYAIATAAMYFANDLTLIYVLRFLVGIGAGGEEGAGVTLIAENFHGRNTGSLISYAASFGQLGPILAAGVAALILPNWHALFLVGLIPVVLAYLTRRNLKENPNFIINAKRRKQRKHQTSIKELFKTPALTYQTLAIVSMVAVECFGYYGIMNWLPTIMQKQLHISASKSSVWMIVTIVGITLGMIAFGKIMDYWGPRTAFTIYLIVAACTVYLITAATGAITLLLASTLVGFFAGGTYSGFGAMISRLYPMRIRVTANGFIVSLGKAIGGLSPIIIGFIMDHYSLMAVMITLSVLYILSLIIVLSIKNLKRDF